MTEIRPFYRGQGIGAALVEHLLRDLAPGAVTWLTTIRWVMSNPLQHLLQHL